MEILIIGDSNIRNCYEKEVFDQQLKTETKHFQTTSKASLKLVLEESKSDKKSIVFYNSWLNEIQSVCKNKNDEKKDKEIHIVVEDTINILKKAAIENPNMTLIVMKPIKRGAPNWMPTKLPKINEEIMEIFYKETPPKNIKLVGAPEIPAKEVLPDHTHFTCDGNLILQEHVIQEILKHIKEENELEEMDTLQASQDTGLTQESRITRSATSKKWGAAKICKTPTNATPRGKRMRGEEEEDEPEVSTKYMRKMDDFMEEMKLICRQMASNTEENKKDIKENKENIVKLDSGLTTIAKKIEDSKKETLERIEKLEKQQQIKNEKSDIGKRIENLTIARMREDLDAFENEKLRDTVIIKKLTSDVDAPSKHSDLLSFIKDVANIMVTELLGKSAQEVLRYTGLAFPMDPTNNKFGKKEIPPIRMQFRTLEAATEFRTKAILMAKKPHSRYAGAYLIYPVNAATRIRIGVMWEISKKLKTEGSESWVAQSSCKPNLMVKKGQYPKSYTYVQAITEFESKLTEEALSKSNTMATKFFPGETERLFVILKGAPNLDKSGN